MIVAVAAAWAQPASAPLDPRAPRPTCPAAARTLRIAAGTADLLESDHFVIAYTTAPTAARELAARLEAVYAAHATFAEQFNLPTRRTPHKLSVVLLATHAEFVEHLRRQGVDAGESLGCYLPDADRSVFFDLDTYPPLAALQAEWADTAPARPEGPRSRFERRRDALARSVIQHEAAHQVQARLGIVPPGCGAPTWLVEGLAMRFEVPLRPDGRPLEPRSGYRFHEFRQRHADRRTLDILPRFLTDDEAWTGGPSYPLAWALVEYLGEQRPEGFGALLRRGMSTTGWPTDPARRRILFDELLGPLDAAWIDRFHAHVLAWPPGVDYHAMERDAPGTQSTVPRP